MKHTTKLSALFFALLLAATSTACGDSTTETTAAETNPAVETETETETSPYDPGLPAADFEGYTFVFAGRGRDGQTGNWFNTDIVVEEQTGDVLDDAIYDRNAYLADTYNVEIGIKFCGDTSVATSGSEMYKNINQSIMSGDKEFDAILSSPYDSIGYALADFVVDLKSIEHLDLSRSWWDQNVSEQLTFGSKVFMASGEMSIVDNKATYVMVFNKQLVEDFNLEDPYTVVREGRWTLDAFIENCSLVTTDLNGDGKITHEDRVGYTHWQDAIFGLIYSTGNSFGQIDENGEPKLTLYSERMITMWDKVIGLAASDAAYAVHGNLDKFNTTNADDAFIWMLEGGHTLYNFATIYTVIQMRISDVDFGIIPNPKFDEAQEAYITAPHAYGNTMLTVPTTMDDYARTGIILQAFTAKSAELVTPAFYDKTLVGKSTRDEQSGEMLDMIFANKHYDIGQFFMWGDCTNQIMNAWNQKNANFTSLYEKYEAKALTDIEAISELFE